MADLTIRRMATRDLRAYKALRDAMLEAHPEAFTSDAMTERHRRADDYVPRLGLERPGRDDVLLGAVGLERDERIKVRHIGHIVSMMVRESARGQGIGRALLDTLIDAAREPAGLEMLTLTVTDVNASAVRLYERTGFARFGTLHKAIKVGDRYHDKVHMVIYL